MDHNSSMEVDTLAVAADAGDAASASSASSASGYESDDETALPNVPLGKQLSPEELAALKQRIETNQYDYDAHKGYIEGLRAASEIHELRKAREAMATVFPMPEDLSIEWAYDEARLALSPEDKLAVIELYSRLVQHYLSIKLWISFVEFITTEYLENNVDEEDAWLDLDFVRGICDQAVSATELHFSEGIKVWRVCAHFETALLEVQGAEVLFIRRDILYSQAKCCTPLSSSDEQLQRMRKMYHSRLGLAHAQLQETFTDYSGFESKFDNVHYEENLKSVSGTVSKTQRLVDAREPFEQKLMETEHSLPAYLDYIFWEKHPRRGDVNRLKAVYERAIFHHCLDASLWDMFLIDMTNMIPETSREPVLLPLGHRATRNCSWSADVWCHYLRALELLGRKSEIKDIFEQAFRLIAATSNMEEVIKVALIYGECVARHVLEDPSEESKERLVQQVLEHVDYIDKSFPSGDSYLRLPHSLLRIAAHSLSDPSLTRKLFATFTEKYPSASSLYLEWANYEKAQSFAAPAVREVYKAASLKRALDYPESIFEAWLLWESQIGVSGWYEARGLVDRQMKYVRERREKENLEAQQQMEFNAQLSQETSTYGKRPRSDDAENMTDGKKNKFIDKANVLDFHEIDNKSAGNMIYVTNLSLRVDETELRRVFEPCGQIVDLILEPNKETGQLEAYIEFLNANAIRSALSQHLLSLHSMPIHVKRCKPIHGMWHFSDTEEKNKIFVSNLPGSIQKGELRLLFNKFGGMREIRVVVKRSADDGGEGYAFAYVEFHDETSAANALSLNGTALGSKKISVALSNPALTKPAAIDPHEVYLTNIPYTFLSEDVESLFATCGKIKRVTILQNADGSSKGSGFVEFDSKDSRDKALARNGEMVEGRVMGVLVPDPSKGKSAGGRKAARGGRGGGHTGRGGRGGGKAGLGYQGRKGGEGKRDADDLEKRGATTGNAPVRHTPATTLVPRTVRKQALGFKVPARPVKQSPAMETDALERDADSLKKGGKTQDDFRKMLMGSK
ncbi:RNA-binding protein 4F [Gaertneriomyces sp. JEL0708]|nr:RNA-binding protein 4F [Gaertneriomyces sp. JEL0708]